MAHTHLTEPSRLTEIWRYPVKSMRGEQLDSVEVGPLGIFGDRAWGIRDLTTGKTLTGRREPRLLLASARVDAEGVVITLPDGTETTDDAALSTWLETDVALTSATTDAKGAYEIQLDFETEVGDWIGWEGPEGSFHDSTKTRVSLVSASNFRDWDPARFRMNLILDSDGEESLVGTNVRVGTGGLELTVLKEVDRCIMVTRPQPGGIERDLEVLKTINKERKGNLGIGANVVSGGSIAVGDALS